MRIAIIENKGTGWGPAYAAVESKKSDKVRGKRFGLPKDPKKVVTVTFAQVVVNHEDRTLEVYQMRGKLIRTYHIPFDTNPVRYEIETESGVIYDVTRPQVMDFKVTDPATETPLSKMVGEYLELLERYNQHNVTDNSDRLMHEMQQTRKIMHILGYTDFLISTEIQRQKKASK